MNQNLQIMPVSLGEVDRLIHFVKSYPYSADWPEQTLRRFFTQLSSSPQLIFDLQDENGRVAVGVLLDKVQNKGNYANLEILGMLNTTPKENILEMILAAAKSYVPSYRSGFEVGFESKFFEAGHLAKKYDLKPYYETFEMKNNSPQNYSCQSQDVLETTSSEGVYKVLVHSFSENIDTSIPTFEDWKAVHANPAISKFFVTKQDNEIVSFLNLVLQPDQQSAEIRTVGVLPTKRHQGLARKLIRHALYKLLEANVPCCHLTVSITNKAALKLYVDIGFKETKHYRIYKWDK